MASAVTAALVPAHLAVKPADLKTLSVLRALGNMFTELVVKQAEISEFFGKKSWSWSCRELLQNSISLVPQLHLSIYSHLQCRLGKLLLALQALESPLMLMVSIR